MTEFAHKNPFCFIVACWAITMVVCTICDCVKEVLV